MKWVIVKYDCKFVPKILKFLENNIMNIAVERSRKKKRIHERVLHKT